MVFFYWSKMFSGSCGKFQSMELDEEGGGWSMSCSSTVWYFSLLFHRLGNGSEKVRYPGNAFHGLVPRLVPRTSFASGESTAEAANDLPSELQVRHWCWC